MPPKRIRRKRTSGWKMPPNTVYVGRPSKWGNVFKVGEEEFDAEGRVVTPKTAEECVELYEKLLVSNMRHHQSVVNQVLELRGKNLACWCPEGHACHADVLLKFANGNIYEYIFEEQK